MARRFLNEHKLKPITTLRRDHHVQGALARIDFWEELSRLIETKQTTAAADVIAQKIREAQEDLAILSARPVVALGIAASEISGLRRGEFDVHDGRVWHDVRRWEGTVPLLMCGRRIASSIGRGRPDGESRLCKGCVVEVRVLKSSRRFKNSRRGETA